MEPLTIYLLTLLLNFLTLYLVVKIYKKTIRTLVTNPAFLLGDFFLIPLYFVLVFTYLKTNLFLVLNLDLFIALFLVVVSFSIVLLFGWKFGLLKIIWIPHGIFSVFILLLLLFGLILLFIPEVNGSYLIVIATGILLVHQLLGTIWSKKISS